MGHPTFRGVGAKKDGAFRAEIQARRPRYFGVKKAPESLLNRAKTGIIRKNSAKHQDFCGNRCFRLDFAHGEVAL
jgi:hypothetical protein